MHNVIPFKIHELDHNKRLDAFRTTSIHSFPSCSKIDFKSIETIVSPISMELPKTILAMAQDAVLEIYNRSRQDLGSLSQWKVHLDQGALMMGYDFHLQMIEDQPKLKLIEINTNASGYLIGNTMAKMLHIPSEDSLSSLKEHFLSELSHVSTPSPSPSIGIVDSGPEQQKLYLEFLMYKDLIQSWGWEAEVLDIAEIKFDPAKKSLCNKSGRALDLIYNRWTDFYFEQPESAHLRKGYVAGSLISPNPKEYFLLADKKRLKELIPAGSSYGLDSMIVNQSSDLDYIEKNKKRLIFKPVNSFGGKSVYRGDRITRKVLNRMIQDGCIAQEYFPPSTVNYDHREWKFDLRFYAYKDKISFAVARFFHGQIMNFQNLGSGFAPINWI